MGSYSVRASRCASAADSHGNGMFLWAVASKAKMPKHDIALIVRLIFDLAFARDPIATVWTMAGLQQSLNIVDSMTYRTFPVDFVSVRAESGKIFAQHKVVSFQQDMQ